MARPSSTIDRLFARLEATARGRTDDETFVGRHVTGIGRVVVGEGVRDLAERLGARAFTTDRGTIAMPELRPSDPENLALLFHEHLHAAEGDPRGGEAEEQRARAREALVLHLAEDEGMTDVGALLDRVEAERDAWHEPAAPGGVVDVARSAAEGEAVAPAEPSAPIKGPRTAEQAVAALLEAGYDVRGIVEALLVRWERVSRAEQREAAYRFAGRTAL
ncbi:MAG: hypothetical protein AAF211_16455 [Myxococcota bacterium]